MSVVAHKLGHWLPQDHQITRKWLDNLISHVDKRGEQDLKPELREFKELIESDDTLKILASLMFKEVPKKSPYNEDPLLDPQVRHYQHMLQLVNAIMDSAPQWSIFADEVGLIGFPINAILDWPMAQWKKILSRWAVYMGSPSSTTVLNKDDGWLSDSALKEMASKGNNGMTEHTFDELYDCNKDEPNYGFKSWDEFFIREFRDGIRPLGGVSSIQSTEQGEPRVGLPIGGPHTDPKVGAPIYNACESTPVYLRRGSDVKKNDTFWLKGQPYSLAEMLDNDPSTPEFVHGTVYQAFLSALSYHRWHSPVKGIIRRAFNVPGTYYSANYYEGFANPTVNKPGKVGPDPIAPNNSQAYITQVAARAVIFIEAEDPDIGLMCFVAVGMCEVSSNQITVVEGQEVDAGDQIGMFHFGGSTHCLLFRKGVNVVFCEDPTDGTEYYPAPENNTPLKSIIAWVKKE